MGVILSGVRRGFAESKNPFPANRDWAIYISIL